MEEDKKDETEKLICQSVSETKWNETTHNWALLCKLNMPSDGHTTGGILSEHDPN